MGIPPFHWWRTVFFLIPAIPAVNARVLDSLMTAFADIMTTVSAVKAGAYGFLTKPFASNEAVALEVLNAAQFKRLRERNERLQAQLSLRPPAGEMVGSSAKMRDVYRLIEGVATSNSTVRSVVVLLSAMNAVVKSTPPWQW